MSSIFHVFPNSESLIKNVKYCSGYKIYTDTGDEILDLTGGATSHMILGWNNELVNEAIHQQLKKFSHIDYKAWKDPNCELLADMLINNGDHALNRVYFCGNSGGEACEASIKMSYQWHCEQGNSDKQWVISRDQSYHGSSSDALCLGDRPNLEIFRPILPEKRIRISEHNPIRHKKNDETLRDYALRSANELEKMILHIGPDNVAAFVAESMMGGLVGDVPPAPGYWKHIQEICNKYNVHLIMDEVYCGTGTSGKYFCLDYDDVKPDFVFMGKTLSGGYSPISVVLAKEECYQDIKNGTGRLQHTTTHQAFSLGVAASIAVQKQVLENGFLDHVNEVSQLIRNYLENEFQGESYFKEVRGRGLRLSMEYALSDNVRFSEDLFGLLLEKHNIFTSCKWHRLSFTPSLNISLDDTERALEIICSEYKKLVKNYV